MNFLLNFIGAVQYIAKCWNTTWYQKLLGSPLQYFPVGTVHTSLGTLVTLIDFLFRSSVHWLPYSHKFCPSSLPLCFMVVQLTVQFEIAVHFSLSLSSECSSCVDVEIDVFILPSASSVWKYTPCAAHCSSLLLVFGYFGRIFSWFDVESNNIVTNAASVYIFIGTAVLERYDSLSPSKISLSMRLFRRLCLSVTVQKLCRWSSDVWNLSCAFLEP
jgi:hypothetical protein